MKKIGTVLLLAGGDSTRFWPLTEKSLFKFLGKPLISHIIEEIQPKADRIVIVVSSQNRKHIEKVVQDTVTLVAQTRTQEGMAGAVRAAAEFVRGEVLILNANDIFNFSILDTYTQKQQAAFIVLGKRMTEYFPGGYLLFTDDKLTGIIEKPSPDKIPSNLVRLVADYFVDGKVFLDALDDTKPDGDDWYERALDYIIHTKSAAYIEYDDYWFTLKYPWQILSMMGQFLTTVRSFTGQNVKISESAILSGEIHIEDNVIIGDHTKIVGPCFIGSGTIVGDFVLIRSSHIGNKSLIGSFTEVARSYVGDNSMFHRNYIGDSVIGNKVLFGSGAVTANYRFDENTIESMVNEKRIETGRNKLGAIIGEGAKIGVNSTLTPGVKIGARTYVGPHTLVSEDIPEGMFCYKGEMKQNKLKV